MQHRSYEQRRVLRELPVRTENKASAVAVFYGGTVLLAKRSENCYITGKPVPFGGHWSIFAGALEGNEKPKECAAREALEEAGIKLDPNKFKYINTISEGKVKLRMYAVESNKILYPKLNPEHTAYGWFDVNTLSSFTEKIDPKIAKSVIKYAKTRKGNEKKKT